MSKDNQTPSNPGSNVVDMTGRIQSSDYRERLRGLKVRFDLENAKIAVSTSLLSIVVLVTLANNNLMSTVTRGQQVAVETTELSSHGTRGIASVSDPAMDSAVRDNPELVRNLASRDLSPKASAGRKPSNVERLAFGFLEGKYAVRLQHGLLKEIEISSGNPQDAKQVENLAAFIEHERALLPQFDRPLKVSSEREGTNAVETYQLVNEVSMPVAKVQFRLDEGRRLISMHVSQIQIASK